MNCPSCDRYLADTLSVCPSCGTMVYDSVREELAMKIMPRRSDSSGGLVNSGQLAANPVTEKPAEIPVKNLLSMEKTERTEDKKEPKPPTSQLNAKHTSPTLVEFHNKNATLPEWRLQLQNSVRRRNEKESATESPKPKAAARANHTETSGATALKPRPDIEENPVIASNPALERAMRRIEESRKKFQAENAPTETTQTTGTVKSFPVQPPFLQRDVQLKAGQKPAIITKLIPKNPVAADEALPIKKFDTNKLPPLPAEVSKAFESEILLDADLEKNFSELKKGKIVNSQNSQNAVEAEVLENVETEEDYFDDCAPLSLRFTAGFFDLLIGSFVSFAIISPFIFSGESVFSSQNLLAFLATCSVVMFFYMTGSIALIGRTLGMKLFSLEIIDADENTYPSIHQAAVSSSVYLLSLAFGGLGFLMMLTNKENRAAHDLMSGTIIVREYE